MSNIEKTLQTLNSNVNKLSKRNDPLSVIMPAIAAEAGQRETVIRDILRQLNDLQAPIATGVISPLNHGLSSENQQNRTAVLFHYS